MNTHQTAALDTPPPSVTEGRPRLAGNMGSVSLALTVLAFSAPLTVVAGYVPFSVIFGGVGTPVAYIGAGLLLLIFSVGFVTLNSIVKRPGDFYAFISYGIGKSMGLGSGLLAAVCYFLLLAGVISFFGVSFANLMTQMNGSALPWYFYSFFAWVAIGVLGYLHIELSAKVLSFVMMLEITVVLVFSVSVLIGSDGSLPASAPLLPANLWSNNPVFAFLFAIMMFLGFEATALYRDELRDPDVTIPRATYGSVIFMGALYTFATYALIIAYGANAAEVATNDPAGMFPSAFGKFVNPRFNTVISVLVLCSSFASCLSTQNVLSRYLFNLGTDGALPKFLNKVHGKHSSPYMSSITTSIMTAVILMPFIVGGANPDLLFGRLASVASAGIIVLMTIVNLSSLYWYVRIGRRQEGISFLKSCLCPLISSIAFIWLSVLIAANFEVLVGGAPGEHVWLLYSVLGVQFVGVALAQYFKVAKPEIYARLGRSHTAH
ncbi:APC family permease [Rhizobium leguminosarum bv. viciae]|nr:APC family permease [Rhizobium leguminosarum bv. viciae]